MGKTPHGIEIAVRRRFEADGSCPISPDEMQDDITSFLMDPVPVDGKEPQKVLLETGDYLREVAGNTSLFIWLSVLPNATIRTVGLLKGMSFDNISGIVNHP